MLATEGCLRGSDAGASALEAHSAGMWRRDCGGNSENRRLPPGAELSQWRPLKRLEERALALPRPHPHSLGASILPSVDCLCSSWYPGPGIIQPGNQAVSLMSAPGRKTDYFFY